MKAERYGDAVLVARRRAHGRRGSDAEPRLTSGPSGGRWCDARSTLPLFPTDDGWPYPDAAPVEPLVDDDIDLDALELRFDPHAYSDLTELEYFVVSRRYGLDGPAWSMKDLARQLECSRTEAPRRAGERGSTSSVLG